MNTRDAAPETPMSNAIRETVDRITEDALVELNGKKFQLGDIVKWTSQAGGRTTDKQGEIVCVLAPGQRVPDEQKGARYDSYHRDHENYIIKVPGKGRYRPRVSNLELVKRHGG